MCERTLPPSCEPNLYLPHYVDIQVMRDEYAAKTKIKEKKKQEEGKEGPERPKVRDPTDFKIFPDFVKFSYYTREKLSFVQNEYLRAKYDKFLDNQDAHIVMLRLHYEVCSRKPIPRPLTLTGKFYDIQNKLAPIPYIPDPRKYDARKNPVKNPTKPKQ